MALQKAITVRNNQTANYWRLRNAIETYGNRVFCWLVGYADEAARVAGAPAIGSRYVTISGNAYSADMNRASLYPAIKALPEWADALDV